MRKTGIDLIGDCPWGTHFCQFYTTPRDLTDILVPYFKAGLENNEFCMWVTSPPLSEKEAASALRVEVPDLDAYQEKGQIAILPYSEWYLKNGIFDQQRVLDGWVEKLREAQARGFDGLRLTGNTFWLERKDWKAFTDYEETVNAVIGKHRMLALCTYSLARCGGLEVLDVVRNHQFALVKSDKGWQLLESSEIRRAREMRRENERQAHALFQALNEGFALHEIIGDERGKPIDFRFLEVNPAFERITGLRRVDVVGKTVRQVVPEIEPFWIETYGKVALTGEPVHFERSGWIPGKEYEVMAYSPAQGQFAALFLDISERRRNEEMLRTSEERYRELVELSPEGVLINQDDRIVFVNPAALRLFGASDSRQILGRSPFEIFHPDFHPVIRERIEQVLAGQKVPLVEERIVRLDGTAVDVEVAASAFVDQNGPAIQVILRDVTERRIAHEQFELQAAKLREQTELLDQAHVLARNLDDRIILWNRGAEQLYGWSKEEALGRVSHELFETSFPQPLEEMKAELRRTGSWEGELVHKRKDGTHITVASHWVLFRDESGKPLAVLEANNDITRTKQAERRLDLLAETAAGLLKSDSPQTVINALCQKVLAYLDCQAFFNYLNDEQKDCLHLNACAGIPEEEARRIEWLDYGAAVCGCAARDGCRIVCEDIPNTPDPRTELVKSYGIRAYACHPLVAHGRVLGTLSFGTSKRTSFTEDELSLMKAVADQVAIALEHRHAQDALRKANDELEKRVAERTTEVREKSRFLEAFFAHSSNPLVFLDTRFNYIRVNRAYAAACRRDVADFSGRNHFEFFPNEKNRSIFEDVVCTKIPYLATARPFSFPDHPEWGVTYWNWSLVPVLDTRGELDFLVFSLLDVTGDQRAQEELRAASRYARSLLEASLDPLVTISPEGKITDVNKASELVTGIDRDHLIGSDFCEYFTEPGKAKRGYQKVIAEGLVRDYPLTIRHVSGSTTDVLYNATVYCNPTGELQGVFAAARDITERKRMEEELRTASHYSRSLIEASLDPLVTISPDGRITDVNRATELVTGEERDRLIGSNFSHYFTEPRKADAGYQRVLAEGLVRDYPLTIRHVSGRTTDVLYNATVYRNAAGEVQGVFAAARDITERKRMERVLQENEERYRSLVTASAQIVWTTNPTGEVVEDMPTWRAFTGQGHHEILGWGWMAAVHPEDRERTRAAWTGSVNARSLYSVEYRIRRIDGEFRHFSVRGVPVLESDGCIREWVGACTDITEQKEAERRRNATNSLLELFARKSSSKEYLDSVAEVIREWSACQALGIRILNEKGEIPYESWVGFDPEFVELERCLSSERDGCFCIHAVTQDVAAWERQALTPGGSLRFDNVLEFVERLSPEQRACYRGTCPKYGFASLAVVPIRYREQVLGTIHLADRRRGRFPQTSVEFVESMTPLIGEAVHRFRAEAELGRYRDHLEELVRHRTNELEAANAHLQLEIAERRRTEETLRRTADELARSNRDLEQFAYAASHDLQEPLRAVAGYVELLRHRYQDKLDDKARQFIGGAVDGAARMQKLVNDLLAFSRVGTQGMNIVPTDLRSALDTALASLKVSIQESGAKILSEPLPTLPVDPTQVALLFQNLIGNAIKFRNEAPPEIRVKAKRQPGRWLFSVSDNGIGLDPQYAERIFLIFQRLHTRRTYPGTGVGLAICKRIVERHGGDIWVESQPEKGSTFHFTIPCNEEEPQ